MKERTGAIIISIILLALGGIIFYFQLHYSSFNFYKSEIAINGDQISEKLYYIPNTEYHTLFRTFQSYIAAPNQGLSNSVSISNVNCYAGIPYYNTVSSCYNNNSLIPSSCLAYTEPNEYGCTFGDVYGFAQGAGYWISAEYSLNPANLFKIKNDYYIKFVVYGENSHPKLITGSNFIINNAITDKEYLPDEQAIVYLPYTGNISKFNIIEQADFQFDNKTLLHVLLLILCLLPGAGFFAIWNFYGKENLDPDIPERLSMYPNKRKASEVTLFFNPPFGSSSPNLFPTILTDFYNRKIIDIKMENKDKDMYVKINKEGADFNEIEKKFMDLLKFFEANSKKEGGFFLLKFSELKWREQTKSRKIYSSISSEISSRKKEFISNQGVGAWSLLLLFCAIACAALMKFFPLILLFFAGISTMIVEMSTSLLKKFKKEYYMEYKQWQSFKKFLKESPSLKIHGHKGTIIWGEFLVYATAFGVAKKVLEEMKKQKLITEAQYNNYAVICYPYALSSHTGGFNGNGSGGAGAGFGGAGAGGVGGGGGGGR